MPTRPPTRPINRPSSFKPPVHHSTPPPVHHPTPPPSFRPPVHHDNPPSRPEFPRPRPVLPPIINPMMHVVIHEHDDEKKEYVSEEHDDKIEGPEDDDEEEEYVSEEHDDKIEGPEDEEEKYKPESKEKLHYSEDEISRREYHVIPRTRLKSTHGTILKVCLVFGFIIALVIPMAIILPKVFTRELHSGPFQIQSIHVVDSETGSDVLSFVENFELYVTNDTADYNAYCWIGTDMTIPGISALLTSIGNGVHYSDVVLYTKSTMPYADSWDLLGNGDNYIWLTKM